MKDIIQFLKMMQLRRLLNIHSLFSRRRDFLREGPNHRIASSFDFLQYFDQK